MSVSVLFVGKILQWRNSLSPLSVRTRKLLAVKRVTVIQFETVFVVHVQLMKDNIVDGVSFCRSPSARFCTLAQFVQWRKSGEISE